MSDVIKIKIIATHYQDKTDELIWRVLDVKRNKQIDLVFPRSDLGASIGVKGDITPEQAIKFGKDVEGREIPWTSKALVNRANDIINANDKESEIQFDLLKRTINIPIDSNKKYFTPDIGFLNNIENKDATK